jgi:2-dehydropantoate 2-reductase
MGVSGYSLTAEALRQECLQVCSNTARNYSPMNRDVFHHRATEIDHITGYLVKQASRYDVELPMNTELLHNIRQLTADKC